MDTWGSLPKSQIDAETIEQAIARIVQEHDDDETAHLETGQSLQSHKASDIIDHLAKSIIADKYGNQSIPPDAIDYNRFQVIPNFDSLDAWYKSLTGTGARADAFVSCAEIVPGSSVGNKSYISILLGNYLETNAEYYPFFDIKAKMADFGACDYRITNRGADPFSDASNKFGLECLYNDNYLYAFYIYNSTKYRQSLGLTTPDNWHRYRCELIAGTQSGKYNINFYIDSILVYTFENITFSFASDSAVSIGIINRNMAGENPIMAISNLVFCQDNY